MCNVTITDAFVQLKSLLMAIYFAADHVVWASQAGLYTDKEGTERYTLPYYTCCCQLVRGCQCHCN